MSPLLSILTLLHCNLQDIVSVMLQSPQYSTSDIKLMLHINFNDNCDNIILQSLIDS